MGLIKLSAYILLLPLISTQTSGVLHNTLLYIHAIGLTCITYNTLLSAHSKPEKPTCASNRKKEMYGLRHTLLNIQFPPKTLWFNMGLWERGTTLYSEACENVMSAIVQSSNIQSGENVLDVGFGCGDSCKYLADKIHCQVTGVTNELSQITIANELLNADQKQRIHLLHGSADNLENLIQPSLKQFDHVISIDSAYHYNTRWDFFKSAYKQLKNHEGTLGLFDFALHPTLSKALQTSPWKLQIFKVMCKLSQIPLSNFLATPDEYKQRLYDAGFKEVQLQTVPTEQVFGGISCYIHQQSQNATRYGINVNLIDRIFLSGSSYVFNLLATNEWIIPVLVAAKKNESA